MVFKATSVMLVSQLLATLVLFFRNILIARLISVEDFGVASTFSILFAVIETASNMSLLKLVVQDPQGDDLRFLNTQHSVQVVRGLASALIMVVLAYPFADFMQTPDLIWAYQLMALVPFARSFLHLDMYRVQRRMQFMPNAINLVGAPILGLAVAMGVYLVSPNYNVMLWAIIAQQIAAVVLSHMVAERRFGLAWEMPFVRRSVSFGMPLLLNGILLMLTTNGERMIVANQLNLVILAWYSAAFMLASTPTRILANTINSLFLPKLSAVQAQPAAFQRLSLVSVETCVFLAIWTAIGIALAGPALLIGTFGPKYAPGAEVLILLGLSQAVRVARAAPAAIAMGGGRTGALFYTGVTRVLVLPIGYLALVQGFDVRTLALIALLGELAAYGHGLVLISRNHGVSLRGSFGAQLAFLVVIGLVLADMAITPPGPDLLANFHVFQIALLGAGLLSLLAMPQLRQFGLDLLRPRRAAPTPPPAPAASPAPATPPAPSEPEAAPLRDVQPAEKGPS